MGRRTILNDMARNYRDIRTLERATGRRLTWTCKDYLIITFAIAAIMALLWIFIFELPTSQQAATQTPTEERRYFVAGMTDTPEPTLTPTATINPRLLIRYEKDGQCLIKGNINSKGQKIYHLPGSSAYEKTKIDLSKGERWFCTEYDAQFYGWRPPE